MLFPTTDVLTTFTQADGPLPAQWSTPVESGEPGAPSVFSNAMVGVSSTDCSAWWNVETFGSDTEVFCTLPTGSDKSAPIYLYARTASENTAGVDAYTIVFSLQSDEIDVYRVINNVAAGPLLTIPHVHVLGSQYGMRVSDAGADIFIEVFEDGDSLGSTTDIGQQSAFPGPGHIGAGLYGGGNSLTRSIDNFGGGTVVVPDSVMLVMGMLGTGRV